MMNNELNRLLSEYAILREDYPTYIIYLLVEYYMSGIELSMLSVSDAEHHLIVSSNDRTRHIITSEDDILALVSMLEL